MLLVTRPHRFTSAAMLVLGFCYLVLYPHALLTNKLGWVWDAPGRNVAMEHMIMAVYGCMGLFLIYGAHDPERFLPLIDFVIVSGIAHGSVMFFDAMRIPGEQEHLMLSGDVIGTYWGPLLLLVSHPRKFYLGTLLARPR